MLRNGSRISTGSTAVCARRSARRVWTISNPARQVTEFMFDDSWKDAAVEEPGGQAEVHDGAGSID
jgi:hypothetical protein